MYLGVEIGGTKLQVGLGDHLGNIVEWKRAEADAGGGREAICCQLKQLVTDLLAESKTPREQLRGIGVGFGGPVHAERGVVCRSHQVQGWEHFPLAQWFHEQFGLRVALNNDSDLAGLAEARIGAGQGCSPMVYMNIGSGIGGAIVINGELFQAQGFGAAEIGHLRIRPSSHELEWSTLESLASGWSLGRQWDDESLQQVHPRPASYDARKLVEAVERDDPAATRLWNQAILHLGVAIANVVTLLHPEVVVIGGGVALAGDILFRPLRDEVDRHVFEPFRGRFQIVPAKLEQMVVVHGALLWAHDTLG